MACSWAGFQAFDFSPVRSNTHSSLQAFPWTLHHHPALDEPNDFIATRSRAGARNSRSSSITLRAIDSSVRLEALPATRESVTDVEPGRSAMHSKNVRLSFIRASANCQSRLRASLKSKRVLVAVVEDLRPCRRGVHRRPRACGSRFFAFWMGPVLLNSQLCPCSSSTRGAKCAFCH